LLQRGDRAEALVYFKRAEIYSTRYPTLEANLGSAYGALKQSAEAERHFLRCLEIDPSYEAGRYMYARWLEDNGRRPEAIEQLRLAVKWNPDVLSSLYLLMEIYAKQESWFTVKALAEYVLERFPKDPDARTYLTMARSQIDPREQSQASETPESLLNLSALYYQIGRYADAILAAKKALSLRPQYPEAYNNIAASYNSLHQWDEAVQAAQKALQLRPNFGSAQHNLARAEDGRGKTVAP
jgi:tetratricopeptide (TPR) repeat protein